MKLMKVANEEDWNLLANVERDDYTGIYDHGMKSGDEAVSLPCHHLWDWAIPTRLDASSYLTSRNCTWSKQQGTSASFTPLPTPSSVCS